MERPESKLGPVILLFFNEAINNSSEEQLASTCIISCSGSQAPSIPRQTILWSKLQKCLVFSFDCKQMQVINYQTVKV